MTALPPHFNPDRLVFAVTLILVRLCVVAREPQRAEIQTFRSRGALLADTGVVIDKECPPMNGFNLSLAHQPPIQQCPNRAQAQGWSNAGAMLTSPYKTPVKCM